MSLGLVITWAAVAAGVLAALAQLFRPSLSLLPLCFGALGALVLEGAGSALGHAAALLTLAGNARGPDAKAVLLTRSLHLTTLGPSLMHQGLALGAVTILTSLAWWRTGAADAR